MDIRFANNASAYLVDTLEADATTFDITPGTGILFPELILPTDFFFVTVSDTDANFEIMKVTGRSADTFTVVRAQEGTEARAFTINSLVENRLTAGSIEYILNDTQATESKEGRVRLATEQDVIDGVSTTLAVTPASLTTVYFMRGMIMPFSGTFDEEGHPIDSRIGKGRTDWHICDGSYYTPDLREKFIMGASPSKPAGTTGGSFSTGLSEAFVIDETTLTVDQMPKHTHTTPVTHGWAGASNGDITAGYAMGGAARSFSETGGSKSHTHTLNFKSKDVAIIPPYYALSYIMKI